MKFVASDPSTLPGVSDPSALPGMSGPLKELRVLMPGTVLRNGRYRLRELQGRQDWLSGVYEAMWVAQDSQRGGSQVMICELAVPESNTTMMVQSMLRMATMALTSAGRHSRVPTLWDAFSDQGQNFFVFEPIEGESLMARMRRTGGPLPEQDVVALCLQIVELLDLLSQQSPPLVHGLIRPEYVMISPPGTQYLLTNFSVVLAGGATQFVSGVDRSQLSPFASPELSRGVVDVRLDLYSLLATAYYAVTGSILDVNSGQVILSAQTLNPAVSAAFDAILMRGLRPVANRRYQRPSELRQDLLGINAASGPLISQNEMASSGQAVKLSARRQTSISVSSQSAPDTVAQMLPGMVATGLDDEFERGLMLPKLEELSPLEQRNDTLLSLLWVLAILVGLIVLVVLGRALLL
jgi:serine/threonine protein kinase